MTKKSKKIKKITSLLGLFLASVAAVSISLMTTSCSNVNSNLFRTITLDDINQNKEYDKLDTINESDVKNLVYGTKNFNDGNYVLLVASYSNDDQWRFLHGTNGTAITPRWYGNYGKAVQYILGENSPIKGLYPNGVKFALFVDSYISENNTNNKDNPFAKYRKVDSDSQIATKEQKDNSEKYRRNDTQAIQYRDIVNFLYNTYSSETNASGWLNKSAEFPTNNSTDGTIPSASNDTYGEITKIMAIAFKQDKDGKIQRSFFAYNSTSGGGSDDGSTTPPEEDNGSGENNSGSGETTTPENSDATTKQKIKNKITISNKAAVSSPGSDDFSIFLRDFYQTDNLK